MKCSVLGSTGVRVSRVCVGTATFGVAPSPHDADGVVGAALDLGINFFDTANVYGSTPTFDRPGAPPASERESAEEILGRALAGRRDEVVLATKSGERRFDPAAGLSRRYIIQQVEQSLRRLRTDHLDLYYAHFPDPDTPLEQTLAVYDDLIRQGKLRYVALSNHPAWQLTEALWIADDRRLASPRPTDVPGPPAASPTAAAPSGLNRTYDSPGPAQPSRMTAPATTERMVCPVLAAVGFDPDHLGWNLALAAGSGGCGATRLGGALPWLKIRSRVAGPQSVVALTVRAARGRATVAPGPA